MSGLDLAGSRRLRAARLAAAVTTVVLGAGLLAAALASASGGGGVGQAPPQSAQMPPDFPSDIPLPPGSLQGSTGSAGRWSVLLLTSGSAASVQRSTQDFYLARGFKTTANAVVTRGAEQITILAAARDHSPTETNLTLGVTSGNPGTTSPGAANPGPASPGQAYPGSGPAGSGPVATIMPGRRHVALDRARRTGLRVRFTAAAGARRVTIRAYRTSGGRHELLGSTTAAVHGGTNSIPLNAVAIRRQIRTGLYTLEVVLNGADGAAGPTSSAAVRVTRTA
jgi:hypothetical protein